MDWKWIWTTVAALSMIALAGCVAPPPSAESGTAVEATPVHVEEPVADAAPSETADSMADEAEPDTAEAVDAPSSLSPQQQATLAGLKSQGAAPELTNQVWINSEPLQLADLRGNVVIVEFWTYG